VFAVVVDGVRARRAVAPDFAPEQPSSASSAPAELAATRNLRRDIGGPSLMIGTIVASAPSGGARLALDASLGPGRGAVDASGRAAADPTYAEATAVPEPAKLSLRLLSRAFDAAPALSCPPLRTPQDLLDVVDHAVDCVARQVSHLVDGLLRPLLSPAHRPSLRPRVRSLGR